LKPYHPTRLVCFGYNGSEHGMFYMEQFNLI
jgi:hypothetical protein